MRSLRVVLPCCATLMLVAALTALTEPVAAATQRLRVSNNGRFLMTQNGAPFFWMGDTNWRLYKLTREDVSKYLNNRRARGFNVIQGPVLLHSGNGPDYRDAYGHTNASPTNPNEQYFQHIDYIVDQADARGMYVALVCVWGEHLEIFGSSLGEQRANARTFGQWVGQRYRNRSNVIWIVAGEYNILDTGTGVKQIWNSLANGLRAGSNGSAMITIHPSYQDGRQSSSEMFHKSPWLSFNMIQSSQSGDHGPGADNWRLVTQDWKRSPVKPTIDAEANYEDIGGWDAFGARRRAYWSVFAGAFGHTYGANGVWNSYRGGNDENYGSALWNDAIKLPGSKHMLHMRRLMESRPMLNRVPAQNLLQTAAGGVPNRMSATRDRQGRYGMIYVPDSNRTFTVRTSLLSGSTVKAWWFNPRTGKSQNGGTFPRGSSRTFTSPGNGQDWVLVLDDASQGYPRPGVGGPRP